MNQPACPAFSRRFVLVSLACSALACSTAEPDPEELIAEVASCGARELVPCDILDRACQEQIAEIAACQWGGPGTPALLPVITTRTEDEYRALLTQASLPTSKARAAVDTTLALLGLIDKGDLALDAVVNRTADLVLAYYDFQSKAILLIDRGHTGDLAQADATLLHELIHAQQDAAHDLAALQVRGASVQERYADAPSDVLNALQVAWGAEQEAPALLGYPTVNVYYRGERPAPDSELIPISLDRLGAYAVYVAARLAAMLPRARASGSAGVAISSTCTNR